MTIRDRAIGDVPPDRASLAAAIRAVDAAIAACEAARLALLGAVRPAEPSGPPPPEPDPADGCPHPVPARVRVETFGSGETFCQACGDRIS